MDMTMDKLNNWKYALPGLYTWTATILFGMTVLDIVYARLAASNLDTADTADLFSEVSDFLLMIVAFTVLTAIGAILSAWQTTASRNLFIASISCVFLPLLFFPFIESLQASTGINLGTWIRITVSGLTSVLAFVGLWQLSKSSP